jgi:hypothetical protein
MSSRLYQPIWEQLKRDRKISVTANRLLHPRIYKAVVKEKWLDIGYKLEIAPYRALLWHSRKNSIITFWLELKLDDDAPISLSDL